MHLFPLVIFVGLVQSIVLEIPEVGSRCITYDLERGDVMVGNYMIWGNNPIAPDVKLTVSRSHPTGDVEIFLQNRIDTKSNFAFTVETTGDHNVCVATNTPDIRLRGGYMGPVKILINIEEAEIPDERDKRLAAFQSADKLKKHNLKLSSLANHVANSRHKFTQFTAAMSASIELVDSVSSKLPGFSILFLVGTVVFLLAQAFYLKTYWKKKRLL